MWPVSIELLRCIHSRLASDSAVEANARTPSLTIQLLMKIPQGCWRLQRKLQQASWAEIATRGRQEVTKRWDYVSYRFGARPKTPRADLAPQIELARFFFSSDELARIARVLRQRFPETMEQIHAAAEQACKHRFNLLGYENLDYGPEVDWHADLVHSKRTLLKPWFKVRYLDFNEVGDSKITWELNRHHHLVTLAKAYLLTGEARYASELVCLWYDWRQKNPYPIGINWSSSLEVAFRTLSWIWIYHLLQASPAAPASFLLDLVSGLAVHGRHIEKYLSTYFSPNTHLLGEGVALFFLGVLYPALPGAERWKRKGWQIVREQATRQVQPDGMHFEQSVHYHVYALDFFLHARILASLNEISIPADFDTVIIKMLEVLCVLSKAGPVPHLGDDDGGRVFDPARNRAQHLLDPLCIGAIVFGRGDFKAAGPLCEEALWLLGEDGIARFDSLAEKEPKVPAALASSGIYVMADRAMNQQLIVDAGPLGVDRAGHGHADALSLNLSVNGREFLSDPGTFSYVSAVIDRNRLRGTGAHNALRIDGLDQAEPDGPFGWRALPQVNVETWQNEETFDLLIATQSPSQRVLSGITHQRTIFYVKPHFWFVRDVVTGPGEHQLDSSWHSPPGLNIVEMAPGSFAIYRAGEDLHLALLTSQNQSCTQSRIEDDYWSPSYGKAVSSSTLRISRNGSLPFELATILLPVAAPVSRGAPLVRLNFETDDSRLSSYSYRAPEAWHHFFFNDSGLKWSVGEWSSDARFFYYKTSPTGSLLGWIIYRGSFLAQDRRLLLSENELVDWREWRSRSCEVIEPGRRSHLRQETGDGGENIPLQRTTEKINEDR